MQINTRMLLLPEIHYKITHLTTVCMHQQKAHQSFHAVVYNYILMGAFTVQCVYMQMIAVVLITTHKHISH